MKKKSNDYLKGFEHGFNWTYLYLKDKISCLEEDGIIKGFKEAMDNLKKGR